MPNSRGNPQDNTGRLFISRSGGGKYSLSDDLRKLGKFHIDPAWFACAECNQSEHWMILVDQKGPTAQFQCGKCKAVAPPFEIHKLQVSDALARKYPRTFVPFAQQGEPLLDMEVDVDER